MDAAKRLSISAAFHPKALKLKEFGRSPDLRSCCTAFPFRINGTVAMELATGLKTLTVAGTAPDFHGIPFSSGAGESLSRTKIWNKGIT